MPLDSHVSGPFPCTEQFPGCAAVVQGCLIEQLREALADALGRLHQLECAEAEHALMSQLQVRRDHAASMLARLTPRQAEILKLVLLGVPSKNIAFDMHISQRTVDNHRAAIMRKTNTRCISALAKIGFEAALDSPVVAPWPHRNRVHAP